MDYLKLLVGVDSNTCGLNIDEVSSRAPLFNTDSIIEDYDANTKGSNHELTDVKSFLAATSRILDTNIVPHDKLSLVEIFFEAAVDTFMNYLSQHIDSEEVMLDMWRSNNIDDYGDWKVTKRVHIGRMFDKSGRPQKYYPLIEYSFADRLLGEVAEAFGDMAPEVSVKRLKAWRAVSAVVLDTIKFTFIFNSEGPDIDACIVASSGNTVLGISNLSEEFGEKNAYYSADDFNSLFKYMFERDVSTKMEEIHGDAVRIFAAASNVQGYNDMMRQRESDAGKTQSEVVEETLKEGMDLMSRFTKATDGMKEPLKDFAVGLYGVARNCTNEVDVNALVHSAEVVTKFIRGDKSNLPRNAWFKQIIETFDSEFDRLAVSIDNSIKFRLRLSDGTEIYLTVGGMGGRDIVCECDGKMYSIPLV